MNAIRRIQLLIAALLCAASIALPAQAAPAPTVEDFFEVAPADRSSAFMAEIFGPSAWQAATFTSGSGASRISVVNRGDDGGILGAISSVLNLACMFLAVVVIGWGAISAALSGAIEGTQAGRRYNVLWTPLRSVLAFGFLLPVMGGYSLVQMIMMWFIHVSIGIANSAYTLVTDQFFDGKPTIPIYVPDAKTVASNVFMMEVCRLGLVDLNGQSIIQVLEDPSPKDTWSWKAGLDTMLGRIGQTSTPLQALGQPPILEDGSYIRKQEIVYAPRPGYASGLPESVCGGLTVTQPVPDLFASSGLSDAADQLFSAKWDAVKQLRTEMEAVAGKLSDLVNQTSGGMPSNSGGPAQGAEYAVAGIYEDYVQAYANYRERMTDAGAAAALSLVQSTTPDYANPDSLFRRAPQGAIQDEILSGGWVMTGAIYWNMQAFNRAVSSVMSDTGSVSTKAPEIESISALGQIDPQTWRQMLAASYRVRQIASAELVRTAPGLTRDPDVAMATYLSTYGTVGTSQTGIQLPAVWPEIQSRMGFRNVTDGFARLVLDDGDFLWSLMALGEVSWNVGWTAMFAGAIAGVVDAAAEGASSSLPGMVFGALGGEMFTKIIAYFGMIIMIIATPLIIIGFFLAFYLPAIPLILWIINIVGWMMQCVKAVLAMPVWAAAHAIPEGEGIAGQHARQGYMLIFGIVLRPLLLVAGILIGAVLVQVTGWLLRLILPLMLASLDVNSPPGFMSALAMMLIVVSLCVTVVLKCFSLSHEIADEVLEWLGGRQVQLGDDAGQMRTASYVGALGAGNVLGSISKGTGEVFGGSRKKSAASRNANPSDADKKRDTLANGTAT